uniref:Uncharacterized protein n=1 Tax=Parascaris univalens TaxID=6257 RepID=A0A915B2J2_PARUN
MSASSGTWRCQKGQLFNSGPFIYTSSFLCDKNAINLSPGINYISVDEYRQRWDEKSGSEGSRRIYIINLKIKITPKKNDSKRSKKGRFVVSSDAINGNGASISEPKQSRKQEGWIHKTFLCVMKSGRGGSCRPHLPRNISLRNCCIGKEHSEAVEVRVLVRLQMQKFECTATLFYDRKDDDSNFSFHLLMQLCQCRFHNRLFRINFAYLLCTWLTDIFGYNGSLPMMVIGGSS